MFDQINRRVKLNILEKEREVQYKLLAEKVSERFVPFPAIGGKRIKKVSFKHNSACLLFDDGTFCLLVPADDAGYHYIEDEIPGVDEALSFGVLQEGDMVAYRVAETAHYEATQQERDVANFLKLAEKIGPKAKDLL